MHGPSLFKIFAIFIQNILIPSFSALSFSAIIIDSWFSLALILFRHIISLFSNCVTLVPQSILFLMTFLLHETTKEDKFRK